MKHFYRICLCIVVFLTGSQLKAAPGDTTKVQSHTSTQLANYGTYDSPAAFPSGTTSYRKINMTFTLGKYSCPAGSQYCGDWDYTVQVYVITPTDTMEIGRLITPYAGTSQFPMTWKHRYIFDVTDYATILKNNATIRIKYSGYSGGFTANVKFDFIEGTPPRNVIAVKRAWHGYFAYGNPSQPIEAQLNNRSFQMPANAQAAALKIFLTGHGGNTTDNCAEFCQKYYQVKLNNSLISQRTIWRDNCGSNNLYPQTGTWVFDRANWCPGDKVTPYVHNLNGLSAGSSYNLDVDFQPYVNNNTQAGWEFEGQVVYYGAVNNASDASLEKIISPSNHEANFRDNQVCQEPKIEIKNNGSSPLTSVDFEYGLQNGTMNTYQWQGSLNAGEAKVVALPTVPEIQNVTGSNVKFVARIVNVNGAPDAFPQNNSLTSTFTPLPVWPNNLVFTFNTNRSSYMGYNETSWKITDAYGNIVKQRINNPSQATLLDTVLLPRGCYRLEMTDEGCDGISWWFYQYYQPNPGTGSFIVREKGKPAQLPMRGYSGGDFGCSFSQTFYVATALGTSKEKSPFSLNAFPNPANDLLQVSIPGASKTTGKVQLINALGQEVFNGDVQDGKIQIPVKNMASGVYSLTFRSAGHVVQKQVVISH